MQFRACTLVVSLSLLAGRDFCRGRDYWDSSIFTRQFPAWFIDEMMRGSGEDIAD
jgi:hypothetical protein